MLPRSVGGRHMPRCYYPADQQASHEHELSNNTSLYLMDTNAMILSPKIYK